MKYVHTVEDALNAAQEIRDAEVQELEDHIDELNTAISNLQDLVDELESKVADLEEVIDDLENV